MSEPKFVRLISLLVWQTETEVPSKTMRPAPTPIEIFVYKNFQNNKAIRETIEDWRLEPEVIIGLIVQHFKDMGFFVVQHGHERLMIDNILFFLTNSPDMIRAVRRASVEEHRRKQSRHAG